MRVTITPNKMLDASTRLRIDFPQSRWRLSLALTCSLGCVGVALPSVVPNQSRNACRANLFRPAWDGKRRYNRAGSAQFRSNLLIPRASGPAWNAGGRVFESLRPDQCFPFLPAGAANRAETHLSGFTAGSRDLGRRLRRAATTRSRFQSRVSSAVVAEGRAPAFILGLGCYTDPDAEKGRFFRVHRARGAEGSRRARRRGGGPDSLRIWCPAGSAGSPSLVR